MHLQTGLALELFLRKERKSSVERTTTPLSDSDNEYGDGFGSAGSSNVNSESVSRASSPSTDSHDTAFTVRSKRYADGKRKLQYQFSNNSNDSGLSSPSSPDRRSTGEFSM